MDVQKSPYISFNVALKSDREPLLNRDHKACVHGAHIAQHRRLAAQTQRNADTIAKCNNIRFVEHNTVCKYTRIEIYVQLCTESVESSIFHIKDILCEFYLLIKCIANI